MFSYLKKSQPKHHIITIAGILVMSLMVGVICLNLVNRCVTVQQDFL